MELEKRIQTDMVSAMKAKETVRLASLRAIKAAILLAKTAEGGNGEGQKYGDDESCHGKGGTPGLN